MFVPVLFQNKHWFLVVANLQQGHFDYINSVENGSHYVRACKVTTNLRKYLDKHGFDTREWCLIADQSRS
jgi:Ulp1 family protease